MKIVGEEDDGSELYKSVKPSLMPDQFNLGLISHKLLRNSY
jgi:hypothetical protein